MGGPSSKYFCPSGFEAHPRRRLLEKRKLYPAAPPASELPTGDAPGWASLPSEILERIAKFAVTNALWYKNVAGSRMR